MIISWLIAFWHSFCTAFRESIIGKAFFAVCNAVSRSWQNSSIIGFLRKDERVYTDGSVFVRIVRLPMAVLDFVKKRLGAFINENIKNSFICSFAKTYINNFIAINTKFFGIMLLTTGLAYLLIKVVSGNGIVIGGIVALALGAVMALTNFNIMKFLNNSVFVNFLKSCLGFKDLDIEAYTKDSTHGVTRLIISGIIGLITGALAGVIGILGLGVPFVIFGLSIVMYAPIVGVFFALFLAPLVPTMALAGLTMWTMLSLVIKSVTDKDFKWRLDSVGVGLILLLMVLFISSLFSFARVQSLTVWAMYFVFFAYYLVIINTVNSEEQLHGLLKVFVISGALVALYGVAQYVFGWNTSNAWIDEEMFEDATMRVYSTLANPNVLGEYLLLVLPVSVAFFLKFKANTLAKWAYGAMFAVLALCLVLTQSRGCWIGFMLSVVIFITFYEGKLWALVPVAMCIIPFVIPETMVDRFLSIGNMDDTSTSYRVFIWMGTLGMLKHYWPGGIGMGESAFNEVYPFFSYNAIAAPHSHNLFLQLTVEAGVVALLVFLVTQVIFLKKMSDVYRLDNKKSLNSSLVLAIGAGVAGFLVQSMFDYTFYNYRVMAIFIMLMAIGMSFTHIELGKEK